MAIAGLLRRLSVHLGLAAVIVMAGATGGLDGLRHFLGDLRFDASPRPAGGEVVLVDIDSRSIDDVGVWPWPRRLYADAIDRLRALGASEIAFDVDFSARSDPADDGALTAALERASGAVILPIFRQLASPSDPAAGLLVNRPLDVFAESAWTATVNVLADRDGKVRAFSFGETVDGTFQPSIPAFFSGVVGASGERFDVDFGIDPATVPQVSFADLMAGDVPAARIAGKKVLIGASAQELRDYFLTPANGLVSGAMVQVLATETLSQGRRLLPTSPLVSLAGLGLLAFAALMLARRLGLGARLAALAATGLGVELAAHLAYRESAVMVDTSWWIAALAAYALAALLSEIDLKQLLLAIADARHRNERAILNRVVSDNFDGILVVGHDRRVLRASAVAPRLLGLAPDLACAGAEHRDLLPPELAAAVDAALSDRRRGPGEAAPALRGETDVEGAEGVRTLEYVVTRSELRELPGRADAPDAPVVATLTFRDVTAERRAEREIREAARLATDMSEAKSRFLATMSHELRTPLNAIIGFSQMIETEAAGPIANADYVEYAGEIRAGGQSLLAVLNDIIDLSRIESGSVETDIETLDAAEIVGSVARRWAADPRAAERHIERRLPEAPVLVAADQRLLARIVDVLLSNAAKFTDPGGRIGIEVRALGEGRVAVEVSDNGIGIAPDALARVRGPFVQGDGARTRQRDGFGLGLAIADGLAATIGARLVLESAPGRGTVARLVLPAADARAAPESFKAA